MKIRLAHTALKTSALGLLALAAAQPLLTGRLPWAADTLIHLYRLVELDHLLRHGYLFPRYAPDLAYGFGFPVFNFYAPLSYYAAMLFRLLGMDFAPALLATLGGLILCAALSMYIWATEVWGSRAGLVAAAAYVTAPYLLYNVYHRGALAEVLAMALMPMLLWAVTRLVRQGGIMPFLFTTLFYAALLLGHNITALVFTPIIGLYAGLVIFDGIRTRSAQYANGTSLLQTILRVALPFLLGLGLSAFFWLPAFAERNSVQVIQLFLPQVFDYHYNFVTLSELFSLPMTVDPNLVLPPTPRSIGLIPLGLTVLALVLGWRRWERQQQLVAGFATVLAAGSLFLTLPQSVAIWDALTLLRFIQFPWRFLSLASLGLAFLASGAFADFPPQRHKDAKVSQFQPFSGLASWWSVSLLFAGMIVYGFTWQYVPYLDPITRPTVADIADYERESGALGTTSAGDYLPNTVKKLPDANALTERYSRADVIERLDPVSLPPDAQVIKAHYQPLAVDVTIESQLPFTATFDIFYFAGWQASVDGQPVAITPTDPHGLISLLLPAGTHRVQVWFGSTPLRTAAEMVSLASLLALVVASVLRVSAGASVNRRASDAAPAEAGYPCNLRLAACVCIAIIGLVTFKSFYLDGRETIFRRTRFDGQRVREVARPLQANFDNQMALIGLDPAQPRIVLGQKLCVTLYWRVLRQLDTDYSISAQLIDDHGFVYGQRDSQHPGGYPTSRWKTSDYARDVHEIELAPGTPPGTYILRVGVYRVGAPSGLSILDASGAPVGTTFDVQVVVARPGWSLWPQPRPVPPKPEQPSGQVLAPGLVLLGYDLPQTQVDVGAKLFFTLYWQTTTAQAHDLKVRLQLIDASGAPAFATEVTPVSPQFPISRAQSGDVLRGPNSIRIPASMPGGTSTLRLWLVDESSAAMGHTVDLGRVTVRVPQRTMSPPRIQHSMHADFGNQVRLVGYDLESQIATPQKSGGQALKSQIEVVLYWQALHEMMSDYKSFVHLLDGTGHLIAGSDAIPANWTRPTTGWITDEYVTDLHSLALPENLSPGDYRLEVGLYDSETKTRLGNSVLLDQSIRIEP